jgi:hypothetical protein
MIIISKCFFNTIKVGIYLLFGNTRHKGLEITVKTPSFVITYLILGIRLWSLHLHSSSTAAMAKLVDALP